MWPVDLGSEVALRRQRLLSGARPRRARGGSRLRTRVGVYLVRLGIVVAGARSFEPSVLTVPCR